MKILGIDPGTTRLGYGVIETQRNELRIIDYGIIGFAAGSVTDRLQEIHSELTKLIKNVKPGRVAFEQLFFYNNQKTAMRVSQAMGVALFAAAKAHAPIFEYTPLQVKQTVTHSGAAKKEQVQAMVKMLLKLDHIPQPDDAADALAIAITCALREQ
ncbi:crossover junction endodeoxyribonuclease RuvC [Candidatus Berkelbacteria bacterium]|nr:crossover junction endodeoxyribonuclease RuvC [Candidatus Berkelbacteria bacterium]